MKVFTLTFVVLLIIATTKAAAKVKNDEKHDALEEAKPTESEIATTTAITAEADTDKKEKEVHKRGIFHHGGALASSASLWPKTYGSHHGYGLHLPAASGFSAHPLAAGHLHAPSYLKYGHGFHYKTLAGPAVLSSVPSSSAAFPTYASLSPPVSHVHPVSTSQPFIIRPGGAVVQSYSVTYPHRKPAYAVKPIHSFASVTPVQHVPALHHVAAVQPVHTFQTVQHVQPIQPVATVQPVAAVHPVQPAVAAVQPVHHLQPVQPVHHLQPVQPVHHLQPVQPVHHLHPVQPVQHLQPIQPPVQTVVQVQHFKPPFHYDVTQQFPSYFQTSFVPPASVPAIPPASAVSFGPASQAFPAIPTFPNPAAFPTIPVLPSQPPVVPDVPAVPAIPNIPTIPSIPNFPQPQVPTNGFFPVSVQPPLNQKPPAFGSVNPQAQFPGFGPIAGSSPDFGSADAAPQIPVQTVPSPEPELPLPQPESTQQPWKPILYEPPTVGGTSGRPSNTLLPPYGSSPNEGYLPPASSSHSGRNQQEYTIDSSLFDNLSDADIQHIFSQASLAAHRDHHHHTVHNYHTRY